MSMVFAILRSGQSVLNRAIGHLLGGLPLTFAFVKSETTCSVVPRWCEVTPRFPAFVAMRTARL